MDIVIPYRHTDTFELKFALRSICKYQPHDRLLLIGDLPSWYIGWHMAATDIPGKPERSVMNKLLMAIPHLSNDFILWQGNIYKLNNAVIKPFYCDTLKEAARIAPNHRAREVIQNMMEVFPGGLYYEGNTPMIMNGEKFKQAVKKFSTLDIMPKSIYGNHLGVIGDYAKDCKLGTAHHLYYLKLFISNKDYFSSCQKSVGEYLLQLLTMLYLEPCKYEKAPVNRALGNAITF